MDACIAIAFDRELCVLYQEEIQRVLEERGDGHESTVVMTTNDKQDPEEWLAFDRDRAEEAKVKARFRDAEDPLIFLIVTAKLLTGFDAPIEGAMYLDKPLRRHTLFQALTRTNRRWTNPATGQEKTHGLIVDYIGLGKEIAASMRIEKEADQPDPLDTEPLKTELQATLDQCLERFQGIDLTDKGFAALQEATATPCDRFAIVRTSRTGRFPNLGRRDGELCRYGLPCWKTRACRAFCAVAFAPSKRGTQDSNLESPVLETGAFGTR